MIILIHYRWKMMNRAWRMSIHRFSKRGQAEGTYNVDIYINNTSVETKNIAFKNKNQQIISSPYSRVLALNNSSSGA